MDVTSYLLGKKAGGGETPATLIDKNISANGTYNASQDSADGYKKVVVNVEPNLQDKEVTITSNTTTTISADSGYDGLGEVEVTTNVPVPQQPTLIEKTITQNGTYDAEDDNADGYSSVTVETSGVDINDYYQTEISYFASQNMPGFAELYMFKKTPAFTVSNNLTSLMNCFQNIRNAIEIDTSRMNTSNITNMSRMFYNCDRMTTLDVSNLDVSNVTDFSYMFYNCGRITSLTFPSSCDFQNTNTTSMFQGTYNLAVLDLSGTDNLEECSSFSSMFSSCGTTSEIQKGAYANNIPYVYVKDATAQNWVLTANNGHPSTWTTANVIIKNT